MVLKQMFDFVKTGDTLKETYVIDFQEVDVGSRACPI